ncbi:DUF2798 domain-containing protein [Lacticaseibacillus camelliae]|uniref:Integral membrane protein n=1 Tax=Lacticaseibacillus camelliae DSM 22697 = JCM 13995 TaxID=1423730 RepID=A0A0R2ER38_9LACO|nr:DUF2798 domain-containing protein [Lacticaseibacillus camelliae]KRN18744.1 hypothetical protein FC75_GL000513 [Lacticaseibacillus camelliae DSM 22697 = JCM 13995]
MPKNFKEEVFFSLIMAGLMVFVMAGYNVAMSDGFSAGYVLEVLKGYPVALGVALVLDLGLVGPIAKKIFFNRIFKPEMEEKPAIIGVWISVLMVAGMVSLMSAFGMIVTANFGGNIGLTYLHTWIFNLFMALPLQLLIVGPIARTALSAFQNRGQVIDPD